MHTAVVEMGDNYRQSALVDYQNWFCVVRAKKVDLKKMKLLQSLPPIASAVSSSINFIVEDMSSLTILNKNKWDL